ncbi:MAG: hypothetical protein WD273_01780 [Trueperaceae bacterium]
MKLLEVVSIVKSLGLPGGDFALHGSAPLLAYGLISETNDVDIVSRGAAWHHATTLAPTQRGSHDAVVRPREGVEIFNGWLSDDANELIDGATIRDEIPFVSLQAVLRFKRQLNRPKDLEHIRLIEHYLKSNG